MALIGISSIHLLKTFIGAKEIDDRVILWQVAIHITFVFSAVALAYTVRLTDEEVSRSAHVSGA
jgi:uncharacterized protein (TIGR00645 family)